MKKTFVYELSIISSIITESEGCKCVEIKIELIYESCKYNRWLLTYMCVLVNKFLDIYFRDLQFKNQPSISKNDESVTCFEGIKRVTTNTNPPGHDERSHKV